MYKHLSPSELEFSKTVMNVFSQAIEFKFRGYIKEVDFLDYVQYEVGDRVDNHYVMFGCRYREDLGQIVISGRIYDENSKIIKRKRVVISEKVLCIYDKDFNITYNKVCDSTIKTLLGSYIELIYTTLFI